MFLFLFYFHQNANSITVERRCGENTYFVFRKAGKLFTSIPRFDPRGQNNILDLFLFLLNTYIVYIMYSYVIGIVNAILIV